MIHKILTFIGSLLCVVLWAQLFTGLDVSGAKVSVHSVIGRLVFGSIVSIVFVAVDTLVYRRPINTYRSVVFKVLLVSAIGSFVIFFALGGILLALGYIPFEDLSMEAVGALILAFLLFLSNFASVLAVKTIYYMLSQSKRDSLD